MSLASTRLGSGEPLVLVHGLGMCKEWWAPVLERLGAKHEVAAVDLPGFGESDRLPSGEDPTAARLSDAVLAFAGEQGWEDGFHVAGVSLGGLVALELARRGAVRSSTAFSPAGFARGRQRRWLDGSLRMMGASYRLAAPVAGRIAPARGALARQVVAEPKRIPAADFAHFIRAAGRSDFARTRPFVVDHDFPFVPQLTVPTTIAWGQKDLLLLPSQAEHAAAMLPGARVVALRRAGHIPFYDDPDGAVRAILDTTSRGRA